MYIQHLKYHFKINMLDVMHEGIFRRNGSINRQQELKALLNQGQTLNLYDGQFTVHDCATVLKSFLAEQPEPIMTEAFYPAYCQISGISSSNKKTSDFYNI